MNRAALDQLLAAVADGSVAPGEAAERLAAAPIADLGFAKLDHHRALRCGFPEVVLCEGKRPEDVARIAVELSSRAERVLLTRADPADWEAVERACPAAELHERARVITIETSPRPAPTGLVAVLTGGTADIPVAEEARVTAELMGARVETRFDVGVAGLHRILAEGELLRAARVLVVCAGMEGALPSVVGGLVSRPVLAVPTSVGYGASFGGLAAFLGMLNSCASNVATVNIDNGFGAGYLAALINADPDRDPS